MMCEVKNWGSLFSVFMFSEMFTASLTLVTQRNLNLTMKIKIYNLSETSASKQPLQFITGKSFFLKCKSLRNIKEIEKERKGKNKQQQVHLLNSFVLKQSKSLKLAGTSSLGAKVVITQESPMSLWGENWVRLTGPKNQTGKERRSRGSARTSASPAITTNRQRKRMKSTYSA